MRTIGNAIITVSFLFILLGMGAATILTSNKDISEIENRKLERRPDLTLQSLWSGEYFKRFETFFSDQLMFRDQMIKAYTQEELFLNKTVINNIIVTEDDWLLGNPTSVSLKNEIDESTANIKGLSSSHKDVEFYTILTPHKLNVLTHKYPGHIEVSDHGEKNIDYYVDSLPGNVNSLVLTKEFKEKFNEKELESMYYRTDHHWNIEGAFQGYQMIIKFLNDTSDRFSGEPFAETDFQMVCNEEAKFIGSNSLQLYHLVSSPEDRICTYPNVLDPATETLYWQGNKSELRNIYATGLNKDEVRYGDMFTWDLSEVIFEKKNAENASHVLILKDSYVNPLTPFIAKHFEKTSILDLRHYNKKTVSNYITDHDVDMVIFMYNDTNLIGEMYRNLK